MATPESGYRLFIHRVGFRANVIIDAVGRPEPSKLAFYARDLAGTVVLVGVPTLNMQLEMPLIGRFSHGGSLKSSGYGDCLPERKFRTLTDLDLRGRFPLDNSSPNASPLTASKKPSPLPHDYVRSAATHFGDKTGSMVVQW
jgi:Zn-dependent alcohol dehydrogenase